MFITNLALFLFIASIVIHTIEVLKRKTAPAKLLNQLYAIRMIARALTVILTLFGLATRMYGDNWMAGVILLLAGFGLIIIDVVRQSLD